MEKIINWWWEDEDLICILEDNSKIRLEKPYLQSLEFPDLDSEPTEECYIIGTKRYEV